MKCSIPVLVATLGAAAASHGQPYYYGPSPGLNAYLPATGGIVMTAGGHVSTLNDAPKSPDGSIRLIQSSVGLPAATVPGAFSDITNPFTPGSAPYAVLAATYYRYKTNPNGTLTSNPPTEREGGFKIVTSGPGKNYDEALLVSAADLYRVAIRLSPASAEPYAGLIQSYWERMIAENALASQDYVDSVRFRMLPGAGPVVGPPQIPLVRPGTKGSALDRQRQALVAARDHLDKALTLFAGLARDPVEGKYLFPEAPSGVWAATRPGGLSVPEEAARLFETFVRSLALALEVEEQIQRLDYLQNYGNPLAGAGTPKQGPGSAGEIRSRAAYYDDYLVLMGAYSHLASYKFAPVSRCKSGLQNLYRLADDVDAARVTFALGVKESGASRFAQGSFDPSYVPFLTVGSSDRTFENLLGLAKGALEDALRAETEAKTAAEEVITNEQTLKERAAETVARYHSQLIDLCGTMPGPKGTRVPDLQGYLLPPDLRLEATGRSGTGAIAVQYARIEQANTRYQIAVQELKDMFREIDITEQAAAEQAKIARNTGQSLARLYTRNGEEFALLDKAAADIQAQTELEAARIQAEVHKKGFFSRVVNTLRNAAIVVGGVIAAAPTGGTSLLASVAVVGQTAINEVEGWSRYNAEGRAIMQTGDLRAKTARRLGQISQAQTRLRAAESADVALITSDGQVRQIQAQAKEQIQKLYVKFERRKLDILLAEQEIDLAELELAGLFEKVGYLLQEYQEAVTMIAESPLERPDFRYIRDYRIGVSEDTFRRAQMWTYLTLKSAQYRFMTNDTFDQTSELISLVLQCRNAAELRDMIEGELEDLGASFYLSNGFPSNGQVKNVVVSLRDQVFQNNRVERDAAGNIVKNSNPRFLPVAGSNGQTPQAASDSQWLDILKGAITGAAQGQPVLELRFSTSFDPLGNNPLHNSLQDQLGHVILSTGGRKGVFVNIKGSSLPQRNYSLKLQQIGTTYITYRARSESSAWSGTGLPVRIWSLPARRVSITPVINKDSNSVFNDPNVQAVSGFDERSPYCDVWLLTIDGTTKGSPNNTLLTSDLAKIKDIQIGLTTQGFDPQ